MPSVVYHFQFRLCRYSYYGECVRRLNVRIDEHIGKLPTIKKEIEPNVSFIGNHLPFSNHSTSYDGFNILTSENKNFLLELRGSFLLMRDQPSLNRNITSVPLSLFDRSY